MPFVEGETLRDRLRREQLLPMEDALEDVNRVMRARQSMGDSPSILNVAPHSCCRHGIAATAPPDPIPSSLWSERTRGLRGH